MKTIIENWNKFILNEEIAHYEMELKLRYAYDMSIYGDIFNKIRAIPGITIVKVKQGTKVDAFAQNTRKSATLNLKFIPSARDIPRYLTFLKMQLLKIKDESGGKILAVRFLSRPKQINKPSQ
jgi:hypothetical protein